MTRLIRHPPQRPIILDNLTCPYCGRLFGREVFPTKEHVIGRKFVPTGSLHGQWNLILQACKRCNSAKADLEDDISAISMLPDPWGRFAADDPRLIDTSRRKWEKSYSRQTRKLVKNSYERLAIVLPGMNGLQCSFNVTALPLIDEVRVFQLARFHFDGFFYFLSFQKKARRGGFLLGQFVPLLTVRRTDWGNPQLRWFTDLIKDWGFRLHGIAADAYFKLIIRRHPRDQIWAWAFEWNREIRTAGLAGNFDRIKSIIGCAPELPLQGFQEDVHTWTEMRAEVPLNDELDDLFRAPVVS